MKTTLPKTIEWHFTNACTGDCVICSKAHGQGNPRFMTPDVFEKACERLVETEKSDYEFQLGGDGDPFLNPFFLNPTHVNYLQCLRRTFPKAHLCLFTSGFSLTRERSRQVTASNLLDRVEVRIDSLQPKLYEQSTGMPLRVVRDNIETFAFYNKGIRLCIIYAPIYLYRQRCERVLSKAPTYFQRVDESLLRNEWPEVQRWVKYMPGIGPAYSRITGLSLWAERTDCAFSDSPCPRLPENDPGDMVRQLYIYPNGDYGFCGYDDGQCEFILGNVFEHSISDVWFGPKMLEYMERIRNRTPEDHPPCCVNPKACLMVEAVDD